MKVISVAPIRQLRALMHGVTLGTSLSLFLIVPSVIYAESAKDDLMRIYQRAGTLAILQSIETVKIKGEVEAFGLSGTASSMFLAPDKSIQMLEIGPLSLKQILNGDEGWMIDKNQAVVALSGFELENMISEAYLSNYGFLRERSRSAEFELLSDTLLGGVGCKQFRISPSGGTPAWVTIDSLTGDLLQSITYLDDIQVVTNMSDFRVMDGIRVAYRVEATSSVPQLNMSMTTTECVFNQQLDPSLFTVGPKPADQFLFNGDLQMTRVEVEEINGHLFVSATVNGSRKARFLLDTGAGSNLISVELAEELGLKVEGALPAKGVAGYAEVGLVDLAKLTIGDVTLLDQTATAMRFEGLLFEAFGGLGGILGYDFFRHFVIQLNIESEEMIVRAPDFTPARTGHGLPFEFVMRIPQIEATLLGHSGGFVIDLGNNGGILAHQNFSKLSGLDTLSLNNGSVREVIGGVGGKLYVRTVAAPDFSLGEIDVGEVVISILESGSGLAGSERIAGNIGVTFLRNYNLTFDYPNQRIWLQELD